MTTVLIVDSEPAELAMLSDMLAGTEYAVVTAASVAAAQRIIADRTDLAAVLLDWQLDDDYGLELLSWIKRTSAHRDLEVIVQSSSLVADNVRRAIELGAYYHLTKPFARHQLRALVSSAITGRDLKRSLHRQAEGMEDCFRLLASGRFELSTLGDAELLAVHIGSACGDPQKGVAVLELLVNAIEHGNLGISYDEKSRLLADGVYTAELERRLALPEHRHRRVVVELERLDQQLEIVITDSGPGFDYRRYLELDQARFFDAHGRGVLLARAAVELEYVDPGNRVRVWLPLQASESPVETT